MKNLPSDLKKYIQKTVLKRLIPCVLLLAVFGALLIVWGERIFNMDNPNMRILCYIVTMLIPLWITGVPKKLIDRTYRGEIIGMRVKRSVDNESYVKPTIEHMFYKNTVYLDLRLDNGKEVTVKAYEGRDTDLNPYFYKKGDRVFHLYGTKNTIVLPTENKKAVRCAVCGLLNSTDDAECQDCGHTLVKD